MLLYISSSHAWSTHELKISRTKGTLDQVFQGSNGGNATLRWSLPTGICLGVCHHQRNPKWRSSNHGRHRRDVIICCYFFFLKLHGHPYILDILNLSYHLLLVLVLLSSYGPFFTYPTHSHALSLFFFHISMRTAFAGIYVGKEYSNSNFLPNFYHLHGKQRLKLDQTKSSKLTPHSPLTKPHGYLAKKLL